MKKKWIRFLIVVCLLSIIGLLFCTRQLLIDNGLQIFGAIASVSPDVILKVLEYMQANDLKEAGNTILDENGYRNSKNELFLSKQFLVLFVFFFVILVLLIILLICYFSKEEKETKELRKRNEENASEIKYMHEAKEETEKKISEYQGNIYHQLATSLSSVRVSLENIQSNHSTQENTDDALYHLNNVNQLLKLLMKQEKYFEKKNNFNKEAFSLNELLDEVVEECKSMIAFNNIEMKQTIEDDFVMTGDDVWLKECFLSVLTNSIEHAGENGKVELNVRKVSHFIRIDITNNGIPLTDDETEHMFERYYSDKPGHMGIGMHMAASIVEQHHGEIYATNEENGVKIHIFLPILSGKEAYL